jgi:hypothetical protein
MTCDNSQVGGCRDGNQMVADAALADWGEAHHPGKQ